MKKNYTAPEMQAFVLGKEDIMLGRDTLIDAGTLWSENESEA